MDKKERILKEAIIKFSEKGYNNTTMIEIARGARVGKGTIYNYFENKQDLINHVIKFGIKKLNTTIKQQVIKQENFKRKLEYIIEGYLQFYLQNYELGKLLIRELWSHTSKFEERIEIIHQNHTKILKNIIEKGQKEKNNEIKSFDSGTITTSLIGTLNAVIFHWMMFRQTFPAKQIKYEIKEIFFNGILENK